MQIHIDGEGAQSLFDTIEAAPFSEGFRRSFIDEILTAPGLRFGAPGVQGLFDGSNMTTVETGDLTVHARLSRAGELMVAAIRALTLSPENGTAHVENSNASLSMPRNGISPDMPLPVAGEIDEWAALHGEAGNRMGLVAV
jgi:hypothetical protein